MLAALRTGLGKVPALAADRFGDATGERSTLVCTNARRNPACKTTLKSTVRQTTRRRFGFRPGGGRTPAYPYSRHCSHGSAKRPTTPSATLACLPSFRALRLNQGTSDVSVSLLLEVETWARIEGDAAPEGALVIGASIIGTSSAMSAIVSYWPTYRPAARGGGIPETARTESARHCRWCWIAICANARSRRAGPCRRSRCVDCRAGHRSGQALWRS